MEPISSKTNTRILWIDYLRIYAIILVVLLHVSSNYIYNVDYSLAWWVANIFDSFSRPGVPLFLMISGLLLLKNKDSIKEFYFKRLKKILIPYFFWSLFYILWYKYLNNDIITFKSLIEKIYNFNSSFHLGFFNYLIGLYIIVPFLSEVFDNISKKRILYFLVLWFIFVPINATMIKFLGSGISIGAELFTTKIGLFILGFYLAFGKGINHKLYIFLYLFSLIGTVLLTFFVSSQNNQLDEFFYQYHAPNVVLMSLSVFVLFKEKLNTDKIKVINSAVITKLSDYSFGVFLIHVFILQLINRIHIVPKILSKCGSMIIVTIPVETIIILILSFLIVSIIKRIPYLKLIV